MPDAVASEEHFEMFLQLVYGGSTPLDDARKALALVELAAYYDAPCVLSLADASLACIALNTDGSGLLTYFKRDPYETMLQPQWDHKTVESYLRLASRHRLRRCACCGFVLLTEGYSAMPARVSGQPGYQARLGTLAWHPHAVRA